MRSKVACRPWLSPKTGNSNLVNCGHFESSTAMRCSGPSLWMRMNLNRLLGVALAGISPRFGGRHQPYQIQLHVSDTLPFPGGKHSKGSFCPLMLPGKNHLFGILFSPVFLPRHGMRTAVLPQYHPLSPKSYHVGEGRARVLTGSPPGCRYGLRGSPPSSPGSQQ